jgi:anti-sigma factor RsiW
MNHDDLQSLLGAYALDALDPEEVAAVEEHLARVPTLPGRGGRPPRHGVPSRNGRR